MIPYDVFQEILSNVDKRLSELEVRETTSIPSWKDVVPTVSQSGAVTLSSIEANFVHTGKLSLVFARLVIGSTGMAGAPVQVVLPLPVPSIKNSGSIRTHGSFSFLEATAITYYVGSVISKGPNAIQFLTNTGALGEVPAFSIDVGDELSFTLVYETA